MNEFSEAVPVKSIYNALDGFVPLRAAISWHRGNDGDIDTLDFLNLTPWALLSSRSFEAGKTPATLFAGDQSILRSVYSISENAKGYINPVKDDNVEYLAAKGYKSACENDISLRAISGIADNTIAGVGAKYLYYQLILPAHTSSGLLFYVTVSHLVRLTTKLH